MSAASDDSGFFDPVEDAEWLTARALFARLGYTPLPPAEVDDQSLPGRLWECLYALAARRFFLHHTDHLSDRELYVWLHDVWFAEEVADCPPEAETNTHTDLTDALPDDGETWLRYYADEDDRALFAADGTPLPPREKPPYDRDRFLPVPPLPLSAHAGELPGDFPPADDEDDDEPDPATGETDPLGLAAVDREIAAAKDGNEAVPSKPDAALGAHLKASEPDNWITPAKQLARENVPLLPPAELTDDTLTARLWELLHNLALRGFYVLHSDHLTDRELYAELWERGLRDPAMLPGRNPRGGWFHDFLGSWGEDDMQLWLRYYASDVERAKHAQEWPKDTLPPKEKPVCNRDWRLPKGPF